MARNNFISIPKPCTQDWQKMSVIEKGRFCTTCQKNVIDFTNLSDRQIENILHNNKNICGRFNSSQLDRELIVPKQKGSFWIAAATGAIGFLGLGNNEAFAQAETKVEQTDINKQDKTDTNDQEKATIEVSGTIYDDSNMPLPGVSIHIKNTSIGTQTDFDGNYKITVKQGDILVFSYIGFKTEEASIASTKNNISMTLQSDIESLTVGLIIYPKKRTFFGRIFKSIGSVFK